MIPKLYLGSVNVVITPDGEAASRAADRILQVSKEAPEPVRKQCWLFKQQIRNIVEEAIEETRGNNHG